MHPETGALRSRLPDCSPRNAFRVGIGNPRKTQLPSAIRLHTPFLRVLFPLFCAYPRPRTLMPLGLAFGFVKTDRIRSFFLPAMHTFVPICVLEPSSRSKCFTRDFTGVCYYLVGSVVGSLPILLHSGSDEKHTILWPLFLNVPRLRSGSHVTPIRTAKPSVARPRRQTKQRPLAWRSNGKNWNGRPRKVGQR